MSTQQVDLLLAGLSYGGSPIAAGKVYTYAAGTVTNKTTWTIADKSVVAANPIILDAQGRANIYAEGLYKFVVKDLANNTLYTWDNLYFGYEDNGSIWCGTSTGSNNVQVLAPVSILPTYPIGQVFRFIAGYLPTGPLTITIPVLGTKSVKMSDGVTALSGSEFFAGEVVTILWDGTNLRLLVPHGTISQSWVPSYSGHASMTFTPVSTQYAKYFRVGKICNFQIYAAGTTGGTASGGLRFTLPFTCASGLFGGGGCWVYDGGVANYAGFWSQISTTIIYVGKLDGSNWLLGSNKQFAVNGWFEVV